MPQYDGSNIFTGIISEDGTIYEYGSGRKRTVIGIDAQKEQEYIKQISDMQETITNYYNKLVELHIIEIPKTPEQIALEQAAEQNKINTMLMQAIEQLTQKVGELSNADTNRYAMEFPVVENGNNGKNNGKVRGRDSSGHFTGEKTSSGDNEQ